MPPQPSRRFLPRRDLWRMLVQIAGFAVGAALLAWCLTLAWTDDAGRSPWDHFREADPWLIGGLIVCTLVSLTVNAATFHAAFAPRCDVGFWNMQRLNVTANALNYLPLRPGVIARIAYHMRVDRLSILEVAATFAAVALVLVVAAMALGGASILRPRMDLVWFALALTLLLSGGTLCAVLARVPFAVRYGRGFDSVLRRPGLLSTLLILRIIDIAAYTGRLGCAMAIVGVAVDSLTYLITIGIVALLFGLFPIRIGFREAGLAAALGFAAGWFDQPEVSRATLNQLALIESAGEAIVYVPLGAMCLPWLRRKWMDAPRKDDLPKAAPE